MLISFPFIFELKRIGETVISYIRAAKLTPEDARIHNNLGTACKILKDYKISIRSYNKAISLRPNHAQAHFNLGNVLNEVNQQEEAIASYRKAIELKPDYAVAYNNLGYSLRTFNKNKESGKIFNFALALEPDLTDAGRGLANFLLEQGKLHQGLTIMEKAVGSVTFSYNQKMSINHGLPNGTN